MTGRRPTNSSCRVLGAARLDTLTIHHGRHTFISHALAGGRSLAEVRDAAGHANVSITSGYLHVAEDDETGVGNLFSLLFVGKNQEAFVNLPPSTTKSWRLVGRKERSLPHQLHYK